MTVGAHCATTISKYVEIWASECVLLKNTSHLQLYREDRIFFGANIRLGKRFPLELKWAYAPEIKIFRGEASIKSEIAANGRMKWG